jgi:alkanesulfonate monooxygenase SsuD/methylene tetrahydromethanopterin reductase-like flavin-dependent oxidoreductase (luciferase family)
MMGGQDARWADLLAMARRAEEVGFDFVGVLDHLVQFWEGWSVLAALAASTSRITLLSYVTCTSYRNPALVAKIADTVDEISGGRLVLGLGAGDSDSEHHIFGYPRDKPVGRFEEAATVITRLLREGRLDHDGPYHTLRDCELRPRGPRPQGPPILVGSLGGKRMQRITAELADIWSAGAMLVTRNDPHAITPLMRQLDDACRAAGRDPATLARMTEVLVEYPGGRSSTWTDIPPVTGTAREIAAHLRTYADLGVEYVHLWIEPNNLAGIEQFAPVIDYLRAAG